jgi:hypothetical protein
MDVAHLRRHVVVQSRLHSASGPLAIIRTVMKRIFLQFSAFVVRCWAKVTGIPWWIYWHSTRITATRVDSEYVKSLAAASQSTRTIEAWRVPFCCSVNYLPCNSSFPTSHDDGHGGFRTHELLRRGRWTNTELSSTAVLYYDCPMSISWLLPVC